MRRWLLLALFVFALEVAPLSANGFGMVRRPSEVRSAYYFPSVVYVPVAAPVVFPMVPAQPFILTPYALPLAAPASTTVEPPLFQQPRPRVSEGSTSLRAGESSYQVLPGPMRMGRDGESERCSVGFWNLTSKPLTLRINNRDWPLTPGKSVTLDLPPTFAWQIAGREAEATRIPSGRGTAEVLIRR